MRFPFDFTLTQALYQAKMKRHGRRYPTVCMLEPLYTCNLACRGCTPERHTGKLADRLSVVLYLIISQHPFNENILLEMLMKNFCEFVKAQGLLSP